MGERENPLINASPLPTDRHTKIANLGWRVVYSLVAWFILGFRNEPGHSFFVSVFLLTFGLALDYFRFVPDTLWRRGVRMTGIALTVVGAIFSFLGIIGLYGIQYGKTGLILKISTDFIAFEGQFLTLQIIWWSIGIFVLLTIVDWLSFESPFEKRSREMISNKEFSV